MDEIILTQRCVPFNFLLQGIEQCLEQHAVFMRKCVYVCFSHQRGHNGTKMVQLMVLKICCLVLAV